jgi:lysyl-tRNA synthetase, class II
LIATRREYAVPTDPHGRWFALRCAGQLIVPALGVTLVLLYLPGHVPSDVGFWARLREAVWSLAGFGGTIPIGGDHFADVLHAGLLVVGVTSAVLLVTVGVRTREPVALLDPDDEQRLRRLLVGHGARDSLGYFALRRDKAVVWSASGKAAISYRVVDGVALASADPLGDPEAWPGAIAAWRELIERNGWTPAVMGCSELAATVYRREYGLAAIALGDEAVVETGRFCLAGRAMRGVRQACARCERAGYVIDVRHSGALEEDELAAARTAAELWRVDPVERGFSMALSRIGDPADPGCVLVRAYLDGQLRGLLHFVPWSDRGVSLDLMRRDRTADNGLNELMISTLLQAAPELGIERVSLNFAVFRDALERGERIGAGPVLRLWRRTLVVASRWWQIESLYRFNDKFRPQWRPRYFSYSRARDIPRIALAALEAEAFIVKPRAIKRLAGRGGSLSARAAGCADSTSYRHGRRGGGGRYRSAFRARPGWRGTT